MKSDRAIYFYLTRIKPVLEKIPFLNKTIKLFFKNYWRVKINILEQKYFINMSKTVWINPKMIKHKFKKKYNVFRNTGKIIDGNWDLAENLTEFDESKIFKAFQERIIKNIEWQHTEDYQNQMKKIKDGLIVHGCKSEEELKNRFQLLDSLYHEIKKNGFSSQKELTKQKNILGKNSKISSYKNDIGCAVGRNGDFIFHSGNHRLSIAKILNLENIPIYITFRHSRWVAFCREVRTFIKENPEKRFYPMVHPDLIEVPYQREEEVSTIIKNNLSIKNGKLLNIGTGWGFFCQKFGEIGFDCFAIEVSEKNLYFLEKFINATKVNVNIIKQSIFEYQGNFDFDIILALDLFTQLVENETCISDVKKLINKLKAKEIYFCVNESKINAKDSIFRKFYDFIKSESVFQHFDTIGKVGRDIIFKLC